MWVVACLCCAWLVACSGSNGAGRPAVPAAGRRPTGGGGFQHWGGRNDRQGRHDREQRHGNDQWHGCREQQRGAHDWGKLWLVERLREWRMLREQSVREHEPPED